MSISFEKSIESTTAPSAPWRQGAEKKEAASFSAKSAEFVPKAFSTQSKEFVPSWKKKPAEVETITSQESASIDHEKEPALSDFFQKPTKKKKSAAVSKSADTNVAEALVPEEPGFQEAISSSSEQQGKEVVVNADALGAEQPCAKAEPVPKPVVAPKKVAKSWAQLVKGEAATQPEEPRKCDVAEKPAEPCKAAVLEDEAAAETPPAPVPEIDSGNEGPQGMQFSASAKEFTPKGFSAKAREFVPKTFSAEAREFVPKSFSASTLEVIQDNCNAISFAGYSDQSDSSDDEAIEECADGSSDSAKDKSEILLPAKKAPSPRTPSTCEGSPTAGLSADEVSSTGSENGTSRSQSPAPSATVTEPVAAPLSMNTLLMWRHATPVARPDATFCSAAQEPEPNTPEAASAAAAKAVALSVPDPAAAKKPSLLTQSVSFAPSWRRSEQENSSSWRSTGEELIEESSPSSRADQQIAQNNSPSWRSAEEKSLHSADEQCWRNVETVKKLEVSEESWAARQRDRRRTRQGSDSDCLSDEDVIRSMKSILNKLTLEKFASLSAQLLQCGIRSASHLEQLIQEVFEKATTQHHFIDMYADLCVLLSQHRIIEDPNVNFKKVLLNCCQASFEKNLTPPANMSQLGSEERTTAELMYKMRMLGNIRFVGALLVRKMLASKVMLSIMEVLLQDPTPEALESLAAFLMVVGPAFDTPDWAYRATLNAVFSQIAKLIKKSSVPSRVRCLLKDVLDIRNLNWQDKRPKKIEGPLKLDQVAAKAAVENSGGEWKQDNWEVVSGGARLDKLSAIVSKPAPCMPVSQKDEQRAKDFFKKVKDMEGTCKAEGKDKKEKKEKKREKKVEAAQFDKEACRAELSSTLAELRVSHDVADAVARAADIHVPVSHQASEFCEIIVRVAEEGSEDVRKLGFGFAAGLFLEKHWSADAAAQGIQAFVEDIFDDLKYDVPALPQIVRDELHAAFAPLSTAKLLDVERHNSLKSVC